MIGPFIERTLHELPGGPFDVQAVIGDLALELAVNWLTGDDIREDGRRGQEWRSARDGLGKALADGQRVMGRRLMVGSIWVSGSCRVGPDADRCVANL